MKRVLFVINTLGRAGAENAMITLMRRLSPEEYDISLFVLTGQGDLKKEIPPYVKLLNSSFSDCPVSNREGRKILKKTCIKALIHKGNIFRRFAYLAGNFTGMLSEGKVLPDKLLWRILADSAERFDDEYDLAVAFLEGGATYYTADYVKAKKKVSFVHIDYEKAGYTAGLDRDCYERIDHIFAVSDEVMHSFIKVHGEQKEKVSVFENLTDAEMIKAKAAEKVNFDENFDGIRILTIGRLTKQKSIDVSVLAMEILKERKLPVRWYVLGDGDRRGQLEKLISEKGLENDFFLLGEVGNPYPYIRRSTIYVHATEFEGRSIAIREAQILGKAIIASDCSGNREAVENGISGILCALKPEDVADAVEHLINDKDLRERFEKASLVENKEDNDGLTYFLTL